MICVRSVVVIVIAVTSLDVRNRCYAASEFEPVQFYKTVPAPSVLHTQEAISLLHCGVLCFETAGCTSFDFRCQSLLGKTPGLCNVLSNTVSSTSQLTASNQCFVQTKIGPATLLPLLPPSVTPPTVVFGTTTTTAVPSTTTAIPSTTTAVPTTTIVVPSTTTVVPSTTTAVPTTTTTIPSPAASTSASSLATSSSSTTALASSTSAPGATIRGFFQNGIAWETDSYIVVTDSGAMVYRNYDALTSGDTTGPHPLNVILPGYSDLPNIADVECIMHLYDTGAIELYAGGKVYIWDGNLNNLHSNGQTYSDYFGSNVNTLLSSGELKMCAYRHLTPNSERHFLSTDGFIVIVAPTSTDEFGNIVYSAKQLNSTDIECCSIWNSLPIDPVAITNKYDDFNGTYVVVKQNLSIYQYVIMGSDGVPIYFGTLSGITGGAR